MLAKYDALLDSSYLDSSNVGTIQHKEPVRAGEFVAALSAQRISQLFKVTYHPNKRITFSLVQKRSNCRLVILPNKINKPCKIYHLKKLFVFVIFDTPKEKWPLVYQDTLLTKLLPQLVLNDPDNFYKITESY